LDDNDKDKDGKPKTIEFDNKEYEFYNNKFSV